MKRMKNLLVKSKGLKSTEEIAEMLHKIANRVAEKKIMFTQGEEETEVIIPDQLFFAIRANEKELKKKGLVRRINLQLRWYQGGKEEKQVDIK